MAKTVFKCNKCGSSSFIIDRKPDYTTICCANKKCGSSWFIEHPKAKVQTCSMCGNFYAIAYYLNDNYVGCDNCYNIKSLKVTKAKAQTCPACKGSKTISVKAAYGYLEAICGNCMGKGKL